MAERNTAEMPTANDAQGDRSPARQDARGRLLNGFPVTERRLSLNGLSTAVLEGGDGAPIVLLHGPGAYAAQWRCVIPNLVKDYRVVAPDLPGHGATDSIDFVDREFVCEWLDDLIECTCDAPPVLVGHTLGGSIAASFASRRPERATALVLVDSFGLAPFQPSPLFGEALNEYLANPTEDTHEALWSRCALALPVLRKNLGKEWEAIKDYDLDRIQAPGRLSSLQHLMSLFGAAIPAVELATISAPTTMIWGRDDLATSVTIAEQASARFGWPLHIIECAADDPTLESPKAFLAVLRLIVESAFKSSPNRSH